MVGTSYSQTLQASGGSGTLTWTLVSGSLPAGIQPMGNSGTISGMPTAEGTWTFTVKVTDSAPTPMSSQQQLTIAISPVPLKVSTTSLSNGVVGTAYSATLQSTGGTGAIAWTYTGSLPAGVTLSGSGAFSGTPTTAGESDFTVTATDSGSPPQVVNQALSVTINPLLAITTTSLPNGLVNTPYSTTLEATGGVGTITWSVTSGTLPAGLKLSGATIAGTPTAAGASNFTVQATDSGTPQQKKSQQLSVTIYTVLTVTTTTLPNGVVGTSYSASVADSGGTSPYTWSVNPANGLPAGLTLNTSTGAITGTPTTAGTSNFTLKVTDSSTPPQAVSQALSITINPLLAITTTSLPNGVLNTAYTVTLQSTGGVGAITWSSSGTLPPPLTLTPSTGVIAGTPTTAGTYNFTVTATDSGTPQQSQNQALSITIYSGLSITTSTTLPNGVVGVAYNTSVAAAGGTPPYSWSATGQPAWMSISPTTGALTGTPTASGTTSFAVKVTDSSTPAQSKSQNMSVTVNPLLAITTTSLPNGVVNTPYSTTLQATGGAGAITWKVTGTLPPPLTLTSSTGVIAGTPTTAGTYNFTVTATDSGTPPQSQNQALSITIYTGLTITTTTLPNGVVNTAYNASVAASGGTPPYTWSATGQPAWMSISSSTGALSGTPTASGTTNFSVKVTDSSTPPQSKSQNLSVTIIAALSITTTSLPNGTVGTAYSSPALAATGGVSPYTWSVPPGKLPPGLSLSSSGGFSGTPTATGVYNFTVTATDSGTPQQTANQGLSITINNPALTILTTTLPVAVINHSYSATVDATGGTPPYTWSYTGVLPGGFGLNSATGQITAMMGIVMSAAGTYPFTVTATDSSTPQQVANQPLSITVEAALTITTTTLPNGSVGTAYSTPLAASGGVTPYTWAISGQPAWLSISPSTGALSGTPTSAGTVSFTVYVKDSTTPSPLTASQPLSLTINGASGGALTITTLALPPGGVNTMYYSAVQVSGGNPPYTWSISSGTLPGALTINASTGVISGVLPATAGTSTFTVKVTDSTTPTALTASRALSLTVNAASAACSSSGNEAVLKGQYAFTLSGFNATGYLAVAGAFIADGTGKITGGEADTNGVYGAQTGNISTLASYYQVGSDNRGCAYISTPFGYFTTRFTLGSFSSGVATKGRLIEFEPATSSAYIAAGQILQQDPTSFSSGPSGNYVYDMAGWDASKLARCAIVGVGTASGGTFSNVNQDADDGGTVTNDMTAITGTYTSFDTYGRATMTISYEGSLSSTGTLYMVSAAKLEYLQSSTPFYTGELQQQTVPTGGFSNASINGPAAFYMAGIGKSGSDTAYGVITGNGSGSFSGSNIEDDSGTVTTESISCTYSVASNGRMAFTGTCAGAVVYLSNANTGFICDMSKGVDVGEFFSQVVPTGGFTTSSIAGTYFGGAVDVPSQSPAPSIDVVTLSSSGGASGASDDTSTTSQDVDHIIADTVTMNSNGTFSVASGGATIVGVAVSATKFLMIDNVTSAWALVNVFGQ
jgi:hypothetical protein